MSMTQIYFSPAGTTEKAARCFTQEFQKEADTVNLLEDSSSTERCFGPEDFLLVALPVYAGRIPSLCAERLSHLAGDRTPAAAMVVYGNREYEDALLELCDLLKERGFAVVGAGAVVGRHCIFPKVASQRPDEKDEELIREFARTCREKLSAGGSPALADQVPGNRPYKELKKSAMIPFTDADKCIECGTCEKLCPVQAILPEALTATNPEKCISCTACIYACPAQARQFQGDGYQKASDAFFQAYGVQEKELEFFL